jgi:hypothetical protein
MRTKAIHADLRAPQKRAAGILPAVRLMLVILFLSAAGSHAADSTLLYNAIVHTGTGETFTNSGVLIEGDKISLVMNGKTSSRLTVHDMIDLHGQHIYPGLIAIDSTLGLTEIDAVRATQDSVEVGDYTPDVESWVAVNPDSELLPVARANGIAYFEPIPDGGIVSGQSALLAVTGWTYEQMTVKKPVALHVIWPAMELSTTPKEKSRDKEKWKSLEDQAKARRAKLAALADFFDEAKAYAKAKDAATNGSAAPEKIPAWEAMLPYARGESPLVIHADEVRQIKSAVEWAATNKFKASIAGGRDAWMLAGLLATNHIAVIYETRPRHGFLRRPISRARSVARSRRESHFQPGRERVRRDHGAQSALRRRASHRLRPARSRRPQRHHALSRRIAGRRRSARLHRAGQASHPARVRR